MKLLCLIGIHMEVKDFFIYESLMIDGKNQRYYSTPLIRQCMHCKKIINKPYFPVNNP